MATIGNITAIFDADTSKLKKGVDTSVEYYAKLRKEIEDLNKETAHFGDIFQAQAKVAEAALNKMNVEATARVSVDTSDIANGLDDVDKLKDHIEDHSPQVEVTANTTPLKKSLDDIEKAKPREVKTKIVTEKEDDAKPKQEKYETSFLGRFRQVATETFKATGEETLEAGKRFDVMRESAIKTGESIREGYSSVVETAHRTREAVEGIGEAFEASSEIGKAESGGLGTAVDRIVVAIGRSYGAFQSFEEMLHDKIPGAIVGFASGSATLIRTMGGLDRVMAAVHGSTAATATVMGSVGGAFAGAAASVATYSAVMAIARYASQGLSKEAQGYVDVAASVVATSASFAVGAIAGKASFDLLASAIYSSKTAGEFFQKVFRGIATGLESGASHAAEFAHIFGVIQTEFTLISAASRRTETGLGFAGLVAQTAALTAAFGAVAGGIEAVAGGARHAGEIMSAAYSGAGAALGAYLEILPQILVLSALAAVATGRFAESIKRIGEEVRSTEDLAFRFGATAEEIDRLKVSAEAAGVGVHQLVKAQQAFYTNISKIKMGQFNVENTREAKLAFDKLGISMQELKDKSPAEVFGAVADAITKVEDPADRTAIAFDLFGRQGAAILPVLKKFRSLADDFDRLGGSLARVDFDRFAGAEKSFTRLKIASAGLSTAMMIPFVELQKAVNNATADINGGLIAALSPIFSLFADMTKPVAGFIEVVGRMTNVFLRMVGVVAKFSVAMSVFGAVGKLVDALVEKFNSLLEPVEKILDKLGKSIDAVGATFLPAQKSTQTLNEKLYEAAVAYGVAIIATGAFEAALHAAFGVSSVALIGSAARAIIGFATGAQVSAVTLMGVGRTILAFFRFLTIGTTNYAIAFAQSVASLPYVWARAAVQFVMGFVTPHLAGFIAVITGWDAAAISARIASLSMAASWAIATLGLSLLVVAMIAVYENFDKLKEYFSDFPKAVSKLFTWDGLVEATMAAADAMRTAFWDALGWLGGVIGNMALAVTGVLQNIKDMPKIDAASATPEEIAQNRADTARTEYENANTARNAAGGFKVFIPEPQIPQAENYDKIKEAVTNARDSMADLSMESARFGKTSEDAAKVARVKFAELQDKLSRRLIDTDQFEEEAKKIQESLRDNIRIMDVITPEQKNEFTKSIIETIKSVKREVREISAGMVIEGKIFPASSDVKKQAAAYESEYEAELKRINKKFELGGYGRGADSEEAASLARENAERNFKRSMDDLKQQVLGFAEDIRKKLNDAFLSPVQKLQRELKKIQDNAELNPVEKAAAAVEARQSSVDETFGKTGYQQNKEKSELLEFLANQGLGGLSKGRAEEERRAMGAERTQRLGLQQSPTEMLESGIDKVNKEFGTTGMTMAQVRKFLKPDEMKQFDDAMKKNVDTVRESLGVQKSSSEQIAEATKRFDDALAKGIISQEERDDAMTASVDKVKESLGIPVPAAHKLTESYHRLQAAVAEGTITAEEAALGERRAKEAFVDSLGIKKSPAEVFGQAIDKISAAFGLAGQSVLQMEFALRGQPEALALLRRAVEDAKESLLQSFGIKKSPMEEFRKTEAELFQAKSRGDLTGPEYEKGLEVAKRKRDEEIGAADTAASYGKKLREKYVDIAESLNPAEINAVYREKLDAIQHSGLSMAEKTKAIFEVKNQYGESMTENNERIEGARKNFLKDLPGAEKENPLEKFNEEMAKLNAARGVGAINQDQYAKNRLNLQAELQEGLKPALESVMPDRRTVEAADTRSKGGVDTFFRILSGQSNPSLKAQLEVANNTKMLLQVAQQPDAAPVIAQLYAR